MRSPCRKNTGIRGALKVVQNNAAVASLKAKNMHGLQRKEAQEPRLKSPHTLSDTSPRTSITLEGNPNHETICIVHGAPAIAAIYCSVDLHS